MNRSVCADIDGSDVKICYFAIFVLSIASSGPDAFCAEVSPPLGHRDFYPSTERPVGWRGDRTGSFPGATPVTNWNGKTGEKIVWKSRMPSPSWGQPIVVGEKVFTTADPNILICVNVHNGETIWEREVDHTTLMPPEMARKAKEELAYVDSLFPIYVDACRDMQRVVALAVTNGLDGENVKKAVIKLGSFDVIDRESAVWKMNSKTGFDQESLDKALANPEIKTQFERLLDLRKRYAFTFQDPRRGDNWRAIENFDHAAGTKEANALQTRLLALTLDYDIWAWPCQNWYAICTMTFGSPCSDGHFVYVAFPNNQVACYDLNGTLKWMVWEHPPENQRGKNLMENFATRFSSSPLLIGDRLVVNQDGEIRVYDTQTGRKVWGVWDPYETTRDKHDKRKGSRSYRPKPEGWSPFAIRLTFDGKPMDLIADGGGNLYRLTDGKVVYKDNEKKKDDWAPDRTAVGDLLVRKSGVYRMKAVSNEQVEVTPVWVKSIKMASFISPIVHDGRFHDGLCSFDLATGDEIPTTVMSSGDSYASPILIGDWIIGAARGYNGPPVCVAPANRKTTPIQNFMEDNTETELPEWSRKPYCGQTGPGFKGPGWKPAVGNGSWYAAANRLFFRSMGYLWCVGDPKQPFPFPSKMPVEAKVAK